MMQEPSTPPMQCSRCGALNNGAPQCWQCGLPVQLTSQRGQRGRGLPAWPFAIGVVVCLVVVYVGYTQLGGKVARQSTDGDAGGDSASAVVSPQVQVVASFAYAKNCEARRKSLIYPQTVQFGEECSPLQIGPSVMDTCDGLTGPSCRVQATVDGSPMSFVLRPTSDGSFLIDYRATYAPEPMGLAAFKAQRPTTMGVYRVSATLADYFNYEYMGAGATYYSIALRFPDTSPMAQIYGYVKQSSDDGQKLFAALKDGKSHAITVGLQYPLTKRAPDITTIAKFFNEGWLQGDEETKTYGSPP